MSMITFSENHESSLIAFEENMSLASLIDPCGEALKWVYSLGAVPSSHVVIIGLGSGFHVAALAELDPELTITVVDSREALVPVFKSQFPDIADRVHIVIAKTQNDLLKSDVFAEVVQNKAYVLSFRECWAVQTQLFVEFFACATGRSASSVRYHFEDLGINMKALYFEKDELLNIKDLLPVIESSSVAENKKQIFRALGELVK